MFTFCRFGDGLRIRATPFVPASQRGLRADGAPIDIDPPSPHWPGGHATWEQCLGAVSLLSDQRQNNPINSNKIPP
jgi:hypothetical protein